MEIKLRLWKPVVSVQVVWIRTQQWNCTRISITSSKVCSWTRKTLWVNILRCLSLVRNYLHLEGINLYRNDLIVSKRPVTPPLSNVVQKYREQWECSVGWAVFQPWDDSAVPVGLVYWGLECHQWNKRSAKHIVQLHSVVSNRNWKETFVIHCRSCSHNMNSSVHLYFQVTRSSRCKQHDLCRDRIRL